MLGLSLGSVVTGTGLGGSTLSGLSVDPKVLVLVLCIVIVQAASVGAKVLTLGRRGWDELGIERCWG